MKQDNKMVSKNWFGALLNRIRIRLNRTKWYNHDDGELMRQFFVRKPHTLGLLMISWYRGMPCCNDPKFIPFENITWENGKLKSIIVDSKYLFEDTDPGEPDSEGFYIFDLTKYDEEKAMILFMFTVICENQIYGHYSDKLRNNLRF